MRKYCHLLFTVLILAAFWSALGSSGVSPFAAAHAPKAGTDDASKLQGVWIVEYTEHGSKKLMQGQRFIFVGNRFFRLDGDKVIVEGTFTIDTSGPVKKIDYRFLKGFRDRHGNDKVVTDLRSMSWTGIRTASSARGGPTYGTSDRRGSRTRPT